MDRHLSTPVLLLIFNRPDTTARVFETIRQARPKQLFIAADGPRPDIPGEADSCAAAREVVSAIDWDCTVRTLFREANHGCRAAVSDAINWFFDSVAEGIILEDDCVPDPSFYFYCRDLLDRYRDDERVFKIAGYNSVGNYAIASSYFYSLYGGIWGWASWRRAWQYYDLDMTLWPLFKKERLLDAIIPSEMHRRYYYEVFEKTYRREIETWDYQWTFARLINRGLSVMPATNLVQNIGFDGRATHTADPASRLANVRAQSIEFPLRAPPMMVHDQQHWDRATRIWGLGHPPGLRTRLSRQLRGLGAARRLIESTRSFGL